ncbi:MAG: hypothetical protein WCJ37_03540 [Syntrophus sp. (in: bacteria)]
MNTLERSAAERADGIRKGIEEVGVLAKGKAEFLKHLDGERLTPGETFLAQCYDCTGYYADGKEDCKMLTCAIYPFMAYREDKPERRRKRELSEGQRAKLRENFKKARTARLQTPPVFGVAQSELLTPATNPLKDDPIPRPKLSTGKSPLLC